MCVNMKVFLTTALGGGGYLLVSHTGRFPRVDEFQGFQTLLVEKNLKPLPGIESRFFVHPVIT